MIIEMNGEYFDPAGVRLQEGTDELVIGETAKTLRGTWIVGASWSIFIRWRSPKEVADLINRKLNNEDTEEDI